SLPLQTKVAISRGAAVSNLAVKDTDVCVGDSAQLPNKTCICSPYSSGSHCETIKFTKAFSNVLVFADVAASDATPADHLLSSNNSEHTLISMAAVWRNKLTFIFSESPPQSLDTAGDRFDVFRRLAVATHGDLLIVNRSDVA
ncbi:hypothetical protein OSTOST_13322, partial [Ostertagia ostertagi]